MMNPSLESKTLQSGVQVQSRFRLERVLGEGGFGQVWLAHDETNHQRPVALKFLHQEFVQDGEVLERFVKESKLLAALDHPNIARSIAWGTHETTPFIAIEFVDGERLDQRLAKHAAQGQSMPIETVERVFEELCAAVAYAHESGVIHRDLKPENIMVLQRAGTEYIKLLDLGIAKIIEGKGANSSSKTRAVGTPMYMAPEQWGGEAVDARTDVFALGAILFEMLTNKRAWEDPNGANAMPQVLTRVMTAPRPDPRSVRASLSEAVAQVVAKALAVKPHERFSSVAALRQATRSALSTSNRAAVALDPTQPRMQEAVFSEPVVATKTSPVSKSNRGVWIALAVVALVGGIGTFAYLRVQVLIARRSQQAASVAVVPRSIPTTPVPLDPDPPPEVDREVPVPMPVPTPVPTYAMPIGDAGISAEMRAAMIVAMAAQDPTSKMTSSMDLVAAELQKSTDPLIQQAMLCEDQDAAGLCIRRLLGNAPMTEERLVMLVVAHMESEDVSSQEHAVVLARQYLRLYPRGRFVVSMREIDSH